MVSRRSRATMWVERRGPGDDELEGAVGAGWGALQASLGASDLYLPRFVVGEVESYPTAPRFGKAEQVETLCAVVPPSFSDTVFDHGVFGARSAWWREVVPNRARVAQRGAAREARREARKKVRSQR